MQAPHSASTLELVVNEQQMHNMSQIDLSRPTDNQIPRISIQQEANGQAAHQDTETPSGGFNFREFREWPAKICNSFSAKLDDAKANSETKTQFCLEVSQAFSGIFVWVLCFVFTIIIPVVLFFLGLTNLDQCPALPSLPYLVFSIGFVMTASNLFNLALAINLPVFSNHSQLSFDIKNIIASILNILFNCIVAFLYILIAYKILTMGKVRQIDQLTSNETNNEQEPIGCNQTLTNFTFWFVAISLSIVAIISALGAILFAYNRYRLAIIRGSSPRSHTSPTNNGRLEGQINLAC